jgi:hypothetical protein
MPNSNSIIHFAGGEDLVSNPMDIDPGRCIFSLNYEIDLSGGYARIPGYVAFDGSDTPTAPAGQGAILGGFVLGGKVYCFRNDAGGAAASLYEATASGWAAVSGVSLSPGGRFETVAENFLGTVGGEKVYWCDGVNPAYEFDGVTAAAIASGATVDAPTHIEAHKARLWLGFDTGEVRYSPVGNPSGSWADSWTQGVIGIGQPVTALVSLPGDALAMFAQERTHILYGSSSADFNLTQHSKNIGSRAYTVQRVTDAIFMDEQGVTTLSATQNYGDFATNSISADIALAINQQDHIASVVVKGKSQYRIYFADGAFYSATFNGAQLAGWMRGKYNFDLACVWRGEIDGIERLFAGSSDGTVYELDKGTSFDGDSYLSVLHLPYWSLGRPAEYKTYRKTVLDLNSASAFDLRFKALFDYGERSDIVHTDLIDARGTRWGYTDTWGSGVVWGGSYQQAADAYTTGTGLNMALILSTQSDTVTPFSLRAATVVAELRRGIR